MSANNVFVAVPTYSGQIDVCATSALVKNIRTLERGVYNCELYFEIGCCYIPQARNRIVAEFLDSDCEDLIMLDSDVYCQHDTFKKFLDNSYHVVFAAYKYRHGPDGWPVRLYTNTDYTPRVSSDGYLYAEVAPTGIMRINRSVFERMIAAHPEWKTQNKSVKGSPIYALFDTGMLNGDGHWYGEDYLFSLRCKQMGIPVMCHPDIDTEHAGGRNNRIGNYHQFLMSLPKPGEDVDNGDKDKGETILGDTAESVPEMVSGPGV